MGGTAFIRYPATRTSFLAAQQKLTETNAAYRAKLELKVPEVIESNKQPIPGFCATHRLPFMTDGRNLFTRSHQLQSKTCPVCDYEHGYMETEPWTMWRVQAILEAAESTWHAKEYSPERNKLLHLKDMVEFVCSFQNEDGETCIGPGGHPTRHSVRNISVLAHNPEHIMCQGEICDQKKKGKSSRMDELKMSIHWGVPPVSWTPG